MTSHINEIFLNELIWREFYMMILWHFPHVVNQSFKPAYDRIPWRNEEEEFRAWCDGMTGYPLVDAGIKQPFLPRTYYQPGFSAGKSNKNLQVGLKIILIYSEHFV